MLSIITPTHDPRYLAETWKSLQEQTRPNDFEWVVLVNDKSGNLKRLKKRVDQVRAIVGFDPRVKVFVDKTPYTGIGARKLFAFNLAEGNLLLELDHDDLLTRTAVEDVIQAFEDKSVDFVYSNCADFKADGSPSTYGELGALNGWRYRDVEIDGKAYKEAVAFKPSAAALRLIFWSPNHLRAWRKEFYHRIGGHNPNYELADDHELLIRTYLEGTMKHLDKCLYLYRMGENNTFAPSAAKIDALTRKLEGEYFERLVLRECQLAGVPALDLGGGFNSPAGWTSVDLEGAMVTADLTKRWPWKDGSVGAFRAFDLLEHLPDKTHTMKEIFRCLRPGGYLLSMTPSTDGRGAFQDPTHVAFWNENSFLYYTRKEYAQYIRSDLRFQVARLFTCVPSPAHAQMNIVYVVADLIKLEGDLPELPGIRNI